MGEPLEAVQDSAADPALDPGRSIRAPAGVQAALSRFGAGAGAAQLRVLKDVARLRGRDRRALELSLPAVKGRPATRAGAAARTRRDRPPGPRRRPRRVARYVALFNARDWDGVRAMLAEECTRPGSPHSAPAAPSATT